MTWFRPRSRRFVLAGCALALALSGCRGDEAGQGAEGESASGRDEAAAVEIVHGSGDPCEGLNGDLAHERCEIVAWVDLDGDGISEPIGVATNGVPEVTLLTVLDGTLVRYVPSRDDVRDAWALIGPDVGSLEARRHAAFVGAYDMTGDGRPELVMWADKGPAFDDFRVLSVDASGFTVLETPLLGMHGGGPTWIHYLSNPHPTYRCTGRSAEPLEVLATSSGVEVSTPYTFGGVATGFTAVGDPQPVEPWRGEVPALGIDCEDLAHHEPAPDPDGESPGEAERCPLGQLPGTPQSDDVGAFIEGRRSSGEIDCQTIARTWEGYQATPKDQTTNGRALIVDFGTHTCSTSTATRSVRDNVIGSCSAMDQSWGFDVIDR